MLPITETGECFAFLSTAKHHKHDFPCFEGHAHTRGGRVWSKWDKPYEMWYSYGDKRAGIKLSSTPGEPTEEHVRFFYKATMRRAFEMDRQWHFVRMRWKIRMCLRLPGKQGIPQNLLPAWERRLATENGNGSNTSTKLRTLSRTLGSGFPTLGPREACEGRIA